jgi:dipeptidyl aminopeptidase/acylaminoacyl peptidase
MKTHLRICAAMTALMAGAATADTQRLITADDLARVRRLETLSLSPDGSRFALLQRQADPVANKYQRRWFIGSSQTGALTFAGDGGEARLARELPGGRSVGSLDRPLVRWSPDGRAIVYTRFSDGAVQLWRSDVNGRSQQLTHNAADVRQFEWSEDGSSIYFMVGATREEQHQREVARERAGYRYDEDLRFFTDLWQPQMQIPQPAPATTLWIVTAKGRGERLANDAERAAYERVKGRGDPTRDRAFAGAVRSDAVVQTVNDKGARAWLTRSKDDSSTLRVNVSLSGSDADAIECAAAECTGFIEKIWWVDDAVLIWRREGMYMSTSGIYTWTPANGEVKTILRAPDDLLSQCALDAQRRLLCLRETQTLPTHVAAISIPAGSVSVLADVNPEFGNFRLGKVERFEWDTPKFPWGEPGQPLHGFYPDRAYGYIYYPPDFDATKKYPVYINPYSAQGFENSTVQETPCHVLAAHGFVVLNTSFPHPVRNVYTMGKDLLKLGYAPELDFPHLTIYAESTWRGLDTVIARGFIDERRVGIGGLSHGAFVPLFMMKKHDRFAAVSIGTSTWSQLEYYVSTRQARQKGEPTPWAVRPEGDGMKVWRGVDMAENVDTIKAPILMNLPEDELPQMTRLIRHLSDAGKPYDVYVFRDETHMKWQPAHLHAIVQRNLDWFDFWLQGREDADPAKAEQYERWRKLKQQHEADRARQAGGR